MSEPQDVLAFRFAQPMNVAPFSQEEEREVTDGGYVSLAVRDDDEAYLKFGRRPCLVWQILQGRERKVVREGFLTEADTQGIVDHLILKKMELTVLKGKS